MLETCERPRQSASCPYSPLGRGLSQPVPSRAPDDIFAADDYRRSNPPLFRARTSRAISPWSEKVAVSRARRRACTPGRSWALAWVCWGAGGKHIVPIPGNSPGCANLEEKHRWRCRYTSNTRTLAAIDAVFSLRASPTGRALPRKAMMRLFGPLKAVPLQAAGAALGPSCPCGPPRGAGARSTGACALARTTRPLAVERWAVPASCLRAARGDRPGPPRCRIRRCGRGGSTWAR